MKRRNKINQVYPKMDRRDVRSRGISVMVSPAELERLNEARGMIPMSTYFRHLALTELNRLQAAEAEGKAEPDDITYDDDWDGIGAEAYRPNDPL